MPKPFPPESYFIFGHATTFEDDGMAKHVHVCPAQGADWGVIYVHTSQVQRLREALQAQIKASTLAMRSAGFTDHDIVDCTAQAREALKTR